MKTIAFVGISGIGKSTFLKAVVDETPFLHLEASNLIKDELSLVRQQTHSSEDLRIGAVLDNQTLLIRAFKRHTAGQNGLVILDGHTVVDTGSGLLNIPASVFGEMNVQAILFLQDDPEAIQSRRAADTSRVRPVRTAEEIQSHQQAALLSAADIALELSIPLHVVTHSSAQTVMDIL
ncbi:AAA family ATPase [Sulfitobacter sp. HNIBRBA3233]|uniref:ATP-binding protein n=1 Tax=Sulfitobacter marinivivus TaxID=3158558 RepID=UPI0032E01D33